METYWLLAITSILVATLLQTLFINLFFTGKGRLPPGPPSYPFVGNLVWFRKSFPDMEILLRTLHAKMGPAVTIRFGPRITIFVADRNLIHEALIKKGAVFSDRPPVPPLSPIALSNDEHINCSFYGPRWRLLRRNMVSGILHPSRVKGYSHARSWVLEVLKARLLESAGTEPIQVTVELQYAMFCLLVFMCFGDKLDKRQISEIERVQRQLLLNNGRFGILTFYPRLAKIILRERWLEFQQLRKDQEDVLIPLIEAREDIKREQAKKINEGIHKDDYIVAYADTLFDLELPEEKRKLTKIEIMGLCSEFLLAGTDTTASALQWIMANIVKYPNIQNKLFEEIKSLIGDREKIGEGEVREEELKKMPYLKAVVLEGLRRHPPGHFVLSHGVTEEAMLGEYVVPKHATLNFMLADIAWDLKVWEDPMAFKPERFMGQTTSFDVTGTKEIKMMPFGVGRRMCPAYAVAMLHLEYFVANLVWSFQWKEVEGDPVDLSEIQEFAVMMKNPLQAHVSSRAEKMLI